MFLTSAISSYSALVDIFSALLIIYIQLYACEITVFDDYLGVSLTLLNCFKNTNFKITLNLVLRKTKPDEATWNELYTSCFSYIS